MKSKYLNFGDFMKKPSHLKSQYENAPVLSNSALSNIDTLGRGGVVKMDEPEEAPEEETPIETEPIETEPIETDVVEDEFAEADDIMGDDMDIATAEVKLDSIVTEVSNLQKSVKSHTVVTITKYHKRRFNKVWTILNDE